MRKKTRKTNNCLCTNQRTEVAGQTATLKLGSGISRGSQPRPAYLQELLRAINKYKHLNGNFDRFLRLNVHEHESKKLIGAAVLGAAQHLWKLAPESFGS